MSFSRIGCNSRSPRAAEVDKSHPQSCRLFNLANGSRVMGVGSREGDGSIATTRRLPRSRYTRLSFSSERWSPKSATKARR